MGTGGRDVPRRVRRGIAEVAALALTVLIAAGVPVRATASAASGAAVPDPLPVQAVPGTDGPVVASADAFTADAPGLAPGQIELTTISTRPSLVTGEEVRIEARGLGPDDHLAVTRQGQDVTGSLAPVDGRPGVRDGVVTGLRPGPNTLVATAAGPAGTRSVTLVVTDHGIQGPVISGPHQTPFVCETVASGMGPPTDADCDAPTQVHWYARDTAGNFTLLADPYAPYPSGTATTMAGGHSVPFVVRVESEVINRSITRIAVLDDPHGRGPGGAFTPTEWNHRLVYHFGESCGTGYHQGSNTESSVFSAPSSISADNLAGPFMDLPGRLGEGYMVAESTLTVFGVHCNQVLSAETLLMVKEHIIDDYGVVTHTIGGGASGGAIQQYTIANSYPGLLDAITPLLSFPDVVTTAMTVYDCMRLAPVFAADPVRWNAAAQVAITGLATPGVCQDWDSLFGPNLSPTASCVGLIPPAQLYDPRTNPHGVRCDLQDDIRNLVGVDPASGFAYRPVGNLGVQYGLEALKAGIITPDDFVALNRAVGGFTLDAVPSPTRDSIPADEATRLYEIGGVGELGALDETPIIDQTIPISDVVPELDIHDQIRPFEIRARLDARYGGHGFQAIWSALPLPSNAIQVADQWLDQLDTTMATHPGMTRAQAVVAARPAAAADQCRLGVTGVPVACDQGVLRHSGPRQAAGGPLSEDDIACQLKAVTPADYPPTVTPAQLAEIRSVFPTGVCDWSRPSVGAHPASATWLAFGDPFGDASPQVVPYPLVRSAAGAGSVATGPSAPASRGGGGRLPATGGQDWAALGGLLLVAGVVLARAGRQPAG